MKRIAMLIAATAILFSPLLALAIESEPGPVGDTSTWMWGSEAFTGVMVERYDESTGGARPVQYFDKARMAVTDPATDQDSPWYVKNGLLVVEMVTGMLQTGDASFEARSPAGVGVQATPTT